LGLLATLVLLAGCGGSSSGGSGESGLFVPDDIKTAIADATGVEPPSEFDPGILEGVRGTLIDFLDSELSSDEEAAFEDEFGPGVGPVDIVVFQEGDKYAGASAEKYMTERIEGTLSVSTTPDADYGVAANKNVVVYAVIAGDEEIRASYESVRDFIQGL